MANGKKHKKDQILSLYPAYRERERKYIPLVPPEIRHGFIACDTRQPSIPLTRRTNSHGNPHSRTSRLIHPWMIRDGVSEMNRRIR